MSIEHIAKYDKDGVKYGFEKVQSEAINHLTSDVVVLCMIDMDNELDFPGGKQDLGETSFQCALHELEEETSIKLSNCKKLINMVKKFEDGVNTFYLIDLDAYVKVNFKDRN